MNNPKMTLEVLQTVPATPSEFVEFWSKQYRYKHEHLYDDNIGKPLTEERVWDLYAWKNGTSRISEKKRQSITSNYLSELPRLPKLTAIADGLTYISTLGGEAIWGIFWLHCINPELFPIFDQHTYRSIAHILHLTPSEIPKSRFAKIAFYFQDYIPFVQSFHQPLRSVDRALFAYDHHDCNHNNEDDLLEIISIVATYSHDLADGGILVVRLSDLSAPTA